MFQQLLRKTSLIGIQLQHEQEQIQLDFVYHQFDGRPVLLTVLDLPLLQTGQHTRTHDIFPRQAQHRNDVLELLQLVIGLEEKFTSQHEVENAPQCPNIDGRGVMRLPQQQFRSPVEERPHHVGELTAVFDLSGHAEVHQLDLIVLKTHLRPLRLRQDLLAFGSKHDVGRLYVPVHHVLTMQLSHRLDDLPKEVLHRILDLSRYQLLQTETHPLQYQKRLLVVAETFHQSYQTTARQSTQKVVFSYKTNRQSQLPCRLELLHCHQFLGSLVASLINNTIGSLGYLLQNDILLRKILRLHIINAS